MEHEHKISPAVPETSTRPPAAGSALPRMTLYVVFHDSVDMRMYEELDENEKSCLTLYGVKERQTTPLRTVYESELPAHNPTLQANKYNEASALYHVHANHLADESGYVGFFHYDMHFRAGAINTARSVIMRSPATTYIFATSLFTHTPFVGGQTSIVMDYPEHRLVGGLRSYNECFGTSFLPEVLVTTGMLMRNSFIVSSQLFRKMMNWMQPYFIDDISARLYPPADDHDFNPGHVIEALTGMFMALEVAQGAVYQRLPLHLEPGHRAGFRRP